MHCANCFKRVEDTWKYCPSCGFEIDKAEGISFGQIQDIIKARKETIDVLKQIIVDLEKYGKMQASSSLITNGAKIVSGVLWLTAPGHPVAVVVDIAATGLGIADLGMSLLAKWKEHGLLERADKICKKDNDVCRKTAFWLPIILVSAELIRSSPHTFDKVQMIKGGLKVCRDGNPQNYAYKPTKDVAGLAILENLKTFVEQCMKVYEGNYSSVAEKLKPHLKSLQEEYDKLVAVSEREVAAIVKATQWV